MHAPTAHTLTAPHVARNALSLTGEWSMLIEHGDLAGWDEQKADAVAGWTTVNIPGQLFPVKDREYFMGITCVWLRTTFTLTPAQAAAGQVLSWGGVRFGAQVWLNGTLIAECVHAGPFTARIPPGIARAGRNTLVLKINGFADMLKAASGFPLFANSAFMQGWGAKNPCVIEDIRIEFYNGVYIKHALAMPDVTAGTATMRVSLEWGREAAGPVTLDAVVREQDTGAEAGRARCTVAAGASTTDLVVRIASPHLWSPGSPYLYSAELIAEGPKGSGDRIRFTFGMREITIVNGHYHLNGKPLWLRGSNLVTDWNWAVLNNIDAREYIVKEARDMNINCFRTHTLPPPASWLNIADAYGMMILAEMPVLFNYADPKYTPDELAVYHSNCIAEVSEWITRLWNHPSVVIWVISNESHDKEWEMGPYHDHVRQLDPTRTTIRAGEETAECIDRHWCSNITRDHVQDDIETLLRDRMASGGNRTIGCTEYMNVFNERDGLVNQWCGTPDISLFPFLFAEICMEHTEAMRRAGLDCILPYMYAGWTRMRTRELWRDDYPTPMAAALHSSFAPCLPASICPTGTSPPAREPLRPLCSSTNWTPACMRLSTSVSRRRTRCPSPRRPRCAPRS
ncbi:hypothetical protein GX586_04365 [bacterium]|nr:hypothetical protein [bacterium]